uniref:Uncharacterized protein n=1 Tax=Arundo donax TaxID=35708 RepID=A0A0A8ZW55_ARUDO
MLSMECCFYFMLNISRVRDLLACDKVVNEITMACNVEANLVYYGSHRKIYCQVMLFRGSKYIFV